MGNKKSNTTTGAARPFLKWVGGKGQLWDDMKSFFSLQFNNYYEPFVGGGSMLFRLHPEKAYINDINKKLVTTYNVIKATPLELIAELKNLEAEYLKLTEDERKSYFLGQRKLFNMDGNSDLKIATLMIFLNKTCFNGMYRENTKGDFNVPFGRYVNPKICNEPNIMMCSEALAKVTITSADYKDAVRTAGKKDFIYLDPPYDPISETSSFTSYSSENFARQEQIELRDLFVELDNRGCKVMLSNSATEFIKDKYAGYYFKIVKARRAINSKATNRGAVDEIIITNYKEPQS